MRGIIWVMGFGGCSWIERVPWLEGEWVFELVSLVWVGSNGRFWVDLVSVGEIYPRRW